MADTRDINELAAVADTAGLSLQIAANDLYAIQNLFDAIKSAIENSDLVKRLAIMGSDLAAEYAGRCEEATSIVSVELDRMMEVPNHG
ncbi:hypothetical protein [Paraburkholderia lycopersici]|uniref:Uncharacterized protein n=1 Tax=Paraburkholderia lycopersici TaxID=416944 RepID=A0A1G6ZGY7_9BURK|nr:hypothetical protein [Paraburkholderia lycopersici]SDE01731.1 hypothetical protein SAMN05421548_13080 [Paraburkholderia lycopersici]